MPLQIGGLGTKITVLYDHYTDRSRRNYRGFRLLDDVKMLVQPEKRSRRSGPRQFNYQPRTIYCLSSGMMTPKTVSNLFARQLIENERCGIFFVGYADPLSPAGQIIASQRGDTIQLDPDDRPRRIDCQVEKFDFSGHAPREAILAYLESLQPTNIVLVHGDDPAVAWFEAQLAVKLPRSRVIVPEPGTPYDLA
jgi:Cft2 family RNA processing exonuclease